MDKIMMWVMAICAMIGGVDQLAGNKFGLGRRFEDGFQLLGPTALFYGWVDLYNTVTFTGAGTYDCSALQDPSS